MSSSESDEMGRDPRLARTLTESYRPEENEEKETKRRKGYSRSERPLYPIISDSVGDATFSATSNTTMGESSQIGSDKKLGKSDNKELVPRLDEVVHNQLISMIGETEVEQHFSRHHHLLSGSVDNIDLSSLEDPLQLQPASHNIEEPKSVENDFCLSLTENINEPEPPNSHRSYESEHSNTFFKLRMLKLCEKEAVNKPLMSAELMLYECWNHVIMRDYTLAWRIVRNVHTIAEEEPYIRLLLYVVRSLLALLDGNKDALEWLVTTTEELLKSAHTPGMAGRAGWVYLHCSLAKDSIEAKLHWLHRAQQMFKQDRGSMMEAAYGEEIAAAVTTALQQPRLQPTTAPRHHVDAEFMRFYMQLAC